MLLIGVIGGFLLLVLQAQTKAIYLDDICGHIHGQRIYLEYGEAGTLVAKYENNVIENSTRVNNKLQKRCTIEFVTCPACIIQVNFRFLNISRNCGKSTVFDTCGCDYVWIYEPAASEQSSGEQFCGRFIQNNITALSYVGQTRSVAVTFLYSEAYKHAFTLDYSSERNRISLIGFPRYGNINNASQIIMSPFFPYFYPADLSMEHVINCDSREKCRISLIFTDFQVARGSIIEFFDWNGQRMYVTAGDIFRPPVIVTTGPSLTVRFYANGASNSGYKATYSFILGDLNETQFKPNTDCGGYVNNLGGGITMMNMFMEGSKLFDCVWLIRPPSTYLHMKTHLYAKVVGFQNFGGSTELTIHQGLTSDGPIIENLKLPLVHFYPSKLKEHVVPITQGFYISLKGLFLPQSRLAVAYAAFNYKDCYAGSDFLCHNLRCISVLLNCDGFDHCGDNSDEIVSSCSKDPRDRRQWSKIPNFIFPKVDVYSDLTSTTLVFLLCSFGFIGLIFAVTILLYRISLRTRQQRQIQDHIETIHAILEEGSGDIEEEIIIPDEPPDYEAPPGYDDIIKANKDGIKQKVQRAMTYDKLQPRRCSRCNLKQLPTSIVTNETNAGTSRETIPTIVVPNSPPPAYDSASLDEENLNPSNFTGTSTSRNELAVCRGAIIDAFRLQHISDFKNSLGKRFGNSRVSLKSQAIMESASGSALTRTYSDSQLNYSTFDSSNEEICLSTLGKSFSSNDVTISF